MARFQRSLVLTPLTRPWLDRAVSLAYEVLTELLCGSELPLVAGESLAPGATYRSPEGRTTVRLDAYGHDTVIEGQVEIIDDDTASGMNARLNARRRRGWLSSPDGSRCCTGRCRHPTSPGRHRWTWTAGASASGPR